MAGGKLTMAIAADRPHDAIRPQVARRRHGDRGRPAETTSLRREAGHGRAVQIIDNSNRQNSDRHLAHIECRSGSAWGGSKIMAGIHLLDRLIGHEYPDLADDAEVLAFE